MKKQLLLLLIIPVLALFCTLPVIAQVYHFHEGFTTNAPPAGWITTNVAWSTTHNHGTYDGIYSAKLKPNESFLICKVVNTADVMQFYCQVRDTTASTNFHLLIEKSTDKLVWVPVAEDPQIMTDTAWQVINVTIKDNSPELYIRFHATAQGGTATLGLCYVDDISITKLAVSPSDATLSDLTYNGTTVEGFTAATFDYQVEVPYFVDQILMEGTPNNPSSVKTITNPVNLRGTAEERTGKVKVTAPDGVTTKTYQIVFTVSKYIYYTGFVTTGQSIVPFDGWTTGYTYVTTTIPMGDHGYFPGPAAFRFIRGQTDKVGYLNTAKYVKSDTLGFWLAVDQGDGFEKMLIEKRVNGGVRQTIANLLATDMGPDWQEFRYAIKEDDSCEIIFTPTITAESPVTRIYLDDLYLTGKPVVQGIGSSHPREAISIHPNPATELIRFRVNVTDPATIRITDVAGMTLLICPAVQGTNTLDIRSLSPGLYFLTVENKQMVSTGKFIRQ